MKRFFGGIRTAWSIVGLTLLMLVLVNQLLVWTLPAPLEAEQIVAGAEAPDNSVADAYADAHWAKDYWAEHGRSRANDWHSYVYWRRAPFSGDLINVDAHGFRRGWNNADADESAPQIWVFGGSVVWGTGVPDAFTLPSQLAFLYAKKDQERQVRVLNFGQSGYVSGQSRLAFAQALACAGQKPELVVFVDGANDVYAAFQSERAGSPQNEHRRATEFNSSQRAGRLLAGWFNRLDGVEHLRAWGAEPAQLKPIAELAAAVVQKYLAYAEQARALADAQGIASVFVWQPHVFAKNSLSKDEQAIVDASFARHRDLQLAADQALGAEPDAAILKFADLYADQPQARFSDFVHIDDQGLEALARAIFDHLPERPEAADAGAGGEGGPSEPQAPVVEPAALSCLDLPVAESKE